MPQDDFVFAVIDAATERRSKFPYKPLWIIAEGFNWTENELREELNLRNYLIEYKKLKPEIRPMTKRERKLLCV